MWEILSLPGWREGNPPRRVILLGELPSSIVFYGFIYMPGRVTLGGGSPYLLGRVNLVGGLTFYHVKGRGRVTLLRGLSFRLSDYSRIRAMYKHDFAWGCLLVEVTLGTTFDMKRGISFDPFRRVNLLAGLPSLPVNRASICTYCGPIQKRS